MSERAAEYPNYPRPAMTPLAAVAGFFVHIDAQTDPLAALLAMGGAGAVLWFIVAQARKRDERRDAARRGDEGRAPRRDSFGR